MVIRFVLMVFMFLRAQQWYKNGVIFIPLVFSSSLFNTSFLIASFLGFISLCLVSSANYVINDIVDRKKDAIHPEKSKRPVASGAIPIVWAIVFCVVLFVLGFGLAYILSMAFLACTVALTVLTSLYSMYFRNEAFADIIVISINFVLRTVSGAFVIAFGFSPYVGVSPWLILCSFFLAFFLVASKRRAELLLLKGKAAKYKSVFRIYDAAVTSTLMILSTAILIMCYTMYVFFSPYHFIFFTLPFVLYVIFRFYYFTESGSVYSRRPELMIKDIRSCVAVFCTLAIVFFAIYWSIL